LLLRGNTLNASLLDLEFAGEALDLGVDGVAVLEALPGDDVVAIVVNLGFVAATFVGIVDLRCLLQVDIASGPETDHGVGVQRGQLGRESKGGLALEPE
jgi:hypothetical protein